MIDSFEFNKMAGAVLGTALLVFGLNEVKNVVYHADTPEKPGYEIEVTEETGGGGETKTESLGALLAKADVAKGQAQSKACLACHIFEKGGANKTGPDLWDIIDRPIAGHEGFEYSEGMKAKAADKWTYENLFAFLKAPGQYVPKTKMAFGGIKRDQSRADLLAYLQTLSDSPKPFPQP
jgi:cytochrome c